MVKHENPPDPPDVNDLLKEKPVIVVNGWEKASALICYQIAELQKATEKNTDAVRQLQTEMAVQKVQSGVIAAISGACSYFIAWGAAWIRSGGKV